MKKIAIILMLITFLSSFQTSKPKVLMYIQDNSMDLNFMLKNEAIKIKQILEQAGFDVDIASISGEILKSESMSIKPDIMLSEVNINNYSGFIVPCMAPNDTVTTLQERNFIKAVVQEGKPLAAQTSAVYLLAESGILRGKKFAMEEKLIDMSPEFKNAVYSGIGVIQDGNIITSGTCPMMMKMTGLKDGTNELTNKLIQTIKSKN